jgi:mRNA-degrading endonuclease RelE of RelBE toxin-antitoxin system
MALVIPPDVLEDLAKVPERDRRRIVAALEEVAADPTRRLPFVTELRGKSGVWRLRKGDWRAVFRWVAGDVVLDRVAHRKDVYR